MGVKGGAAVDDKYLIVVLVLVILFGASRLPSLGRNFGQGIREFRKGLAEGTQDASEAAAPTPPDDGGTSQTDTAHLGHGGE
jgi:sec-independent protein translocase protein TatA